ncbi:MAG: hypothetical protein CVV44_17190 [Spirochaetae bacterium HGW-Spirochaetae-1]|jgi:hypothetical protein|nr:MAG: hypothetical protein CVV44_17190 [Spirochaetae bacterium HGW-Spirochaetae-1]
MKLEEIMEKYYAREIGQQHIPGMPPESSESMAYRPVIRRQSSLYLNILFNGMAAALIIIVVLTHGSHRNPLIDVLGAVNETYDVETSFSLKLESLRGIIKYRK